MNRTIIIFFTSVLISVSVNAFGQLDSIVLKDIIWDKTSPAGTTELSIPSGGTMLAGLIYRANGPAKHPVLVLLHGYPGNERSLDLAQVVRAHGWNVVYFDYRGSWGSQGKFNFKNCIEDVVNVVAFCKKYQDSLKIDTSNMVLFGHSMGGWLCLKAVQQLPGIHKAFALSTWDIPYAVRSEAALSASEKRADNLFVLNKQSGQELFKPVVENPGYYDLANDSTRLSSKQIIMLDEHRRNQHIADAIKTSNKNYFDYEVWETDHPFSNKRISLINKVIWFLDK